MKTITYVDIDYVDSTVYSNYFGTLARVGHEQCIYAMDLDLLLNKIILANDIVIRLNESNLIVLKDLLNNPENYNVEKYDNKIELLNHLIKTRFKNVKFRPITDIVYLNLLSDIFRYNCKDIYSKPVQLDKKTLSILKSMGIVVRNC